MMKAATKTAAPATRTTAGSASITRATGNRIRASRRLSGARSRMPKPSATMRAARPPHLSPALDAVAERLPFADASFDASMATFTGPALVLTCDPDRCDRLTWLAAHLQEVIAVETARYPPIATIARALGARSEIIPVPIPFDCTDGFTEAYYGRPELLLDAGVRRACSAWSFLDARVVERFMTELSRDLESGDGTQGTDISGRSLRLTARLDRSSAGAPSGRLRACGR